ncbi:MAG: tyrosine-type recombinase/integrase [Mycetocola sp.]
MTTPRVRIIRGGEWNPDVVRAELGLEPLALQPLESPALTIDGAIEPDATAWLAHVFSRTRGRTGTKTAESYAESLCLFLEYVASQSSTLRGVTNKHIVGYVNRRTVDEDTRVSGSTWSRDRTAIKQFYEWMQINHNITLPFTVDHLTTSRGTVTSMREGRGVAKASAAGTPLEPPQVGQLLAAAWRLDSSGQVDDRNVTGPRDAAFIALGVACGARANTLAHLTVYDLPDPRTQEHLIEMRLPAVIAKTRREVRLPAFVNHLKHVWSYAEQNGGSRTALLRDWKPESPIHVAEQPTPQRRTIIDTRGNEHPLAMMSAADRRRLVTPEGDTAMLFLSARDGSPLSYATARELTANASELAETRADLLGDVFPHVHTHDLRHTYATHLAALFLLGIPTAPGRDMHGKPHRVDIRSAVQLASTGLGHVSEATTALYIQQVGMMVLRYTLDDFLGGGR